MKNIRFGIMGAGNIAHQFCDAVRRVDGADVVAVSSKTLEKARIFAEKENIPSYYGNYGEMLARDDIDAVYIATTHNFHYENMLECIAHNKHILCEKCMVLNKKDAEHIFSLAKEKNLFVMEAMWVRFLPNIQKVKSWIRDGRIGSPEMATVSIGFKANDDPNNRIYNPALAGGSMFDIGVYMFEVMNYIIGEEIKDIKTTLSLAPTGVDKSACVTVKYENCIANLQCCVSSAVIEKAYIYGTEGTIEFPMLHWVRDCVLYDSSHKVVEVFKDCPSNGFIFEVKEVVDCINNGKLESDIIPHRDTIQCAELFDLCFDK
ncbi:MAG: Gfo/Idh/MocA family oxidoreductase [Clostridia bacterium]|nr:Gfo/Idh/MocA family oxidoreductase [Clostridia bacterium]